MIKTLKTSRHTIEHIIRPAMDRVCLEPQDNTRNRLLELKGKVLSIPFLRTHFVVVHLTEGCISYLQGSFLVVTPLGIVRTYSSTSRQWKAFLNTE